MSRFTESLKRLGFGSYAEYLCSEHWASFKTTYKVSGRSMKCDVCTLGPIQLHHHTYERLGEERVGDVTPLCRIHHRAVHEWLKTSGKVFVGFTHEAVAFLRGVNTTIIPPDRWDETHRITRRKRSRSDKNPKQYGEPSQSIHELGRRAKELALKKTKPGKALRAIEIYVAGQQWRALGKLIAKLNRTLDEKLPEAKKRVHLPFQGNAKAKPDTNVKRRALRLKAILAAHKRRKTP